MERLCSAQGEPSRSSLSCTNPCRKSTAREAAGRSKLDLVGVSLEAPYCAAVEPPTGKCAHCTWGRSPQSPATASRTCRSETSAGGPLSCRCLASRAARLGGVLGGDSGRDGSK
eukprot:scaffold52159_cov31-Tisochrysis_lutea.AAC.4